MVRDEELKRLVKYMEGMGVKVEFKRSKANHHTGAEWDLTGSLITVYVAPKDPKIDLILYLIHECGHHISFVHDDNRQHPKGLEQAIVKENQGLKMSKRDRKLILDSELKGMKWWDVIYRETNMKFPKYKLWHAREFDTWWYNYFYQVGKYPSRKEKVIKYKQLKEIFNKHMDIEAYEISHNL